MANQYRGQFEIKVGGKKYTLRVGTNEIAALEDTFGVGEFKELQERLRRLSLKDVRTFTKICLERHQPDVTDEQAGDLIDEHGLENVTDKIAEGLVVAFMGPKAARAVKAAAPAEAPPNA